MPITRREFVYTLGATGLALASSDLVGRSDRSDTAWPGARIAVQGPGRRVTQ